MTNKLNWLVKPPSDMYDIAEVEEQIIAHLEWCGVYDKPSNLWWHTEELKNNDGVHITPSDCGLYFDCDYIRKLKYETIKLGEHEYEAETNFKTGNKDAKRN